MEYRGFPQNVSGPGFVIGVAQSGEPALRLTRAGIALPLAIAVFWPCGFAQGPPGRPEDDHALSYGAETDFSSGYVWRGLLQNDGPVMQQTAWISRFGLTFSAWNSLPLTRKSDSAHVADTSLTLAYLRDWKKLRVEPTIEMYPDRWHKGADGPNTMEGSLEVSYPVGPLRVFTSHAFDVLAYRGSYFGEAGLGYEGRVTKRAQLAVSVHSGWASSKFNDIYIGLRKRAFNFIGAEGSLTYYLKPQLYIRPHLEFSNIVDRRLREQLSTPTVLSGGFAMGVEF